MIEGVSGSSSCGSSAVYGVPSATEALKEAAKVDVTDPQTANEAGPAAASSQYLLDVLA